MIIIKTEKEIAIIRQGGKILANILKKLIAEVKPGVTTGHLEKMACELIKQAGGRPSFKGYKSMHDAQGFPTALCASINNEVVHAPAIPSRRLNTGDIIDIDIGMEYPIFATQSRGIAADRPVNADSEMGGYYTDMSATTPVGKISKQAKKLINVTRKSLELAIKQVKPGNSLNDIGKAIQQYVESQGFSVVRDLVGHGVGVAVHEEPQVPNYEIANPKDNIILKPGMVIAIEPMVNIEDWKVKNGKDGFTIVTADGSLSAHFEHTVAVTEKGCRVLTFL
ncbi:MAG: type I methionyl aminopeptidase [Patescibacteria group bacterium]|nr:type I methionyl aminopeptidase [Patescibacteria group bacterium]